MNKDKILVINPGSTTTKIALFDMDGANIYEENITHDEDRILGFSDVASQKEYRLGFLLDALDKAGISREELVAVVGRGGMLYELKEGGYLVTKELVEKMSDRSLPQHASSLGAILAFAIAEPLDIPSYIYDSPMGADIMDIAKITGIAELEKYGSVHLLNTRAQALEYAKSVGKDLKDVELLVCHMGGGITASALKDGKVVDCALYDDGPMAPERSGGVPLLLFKKLCFSGKYTEEEVDRLIAGKGGMYSYLGTKSGREVEERIKNGDEKAALVFEAMAYQVAKSLAGLSCALEGKQEVIILTGGLAHSGLLTQTIEKYVKHIAPVKVMPGEKELEALAQGAIRMLTGRETAQKI